MNIQQYTKWMLAAAATCAMAAPAHANTCNDESPLLKEIGESYGELQYSPQDRASAAQSGSGNAKSRRKHLRTMSLLEFFNSKDLKTGKGERVKCIDVKSGLRKTHIDFTLEDVTRIEAVNGKVMLTAWEESSRKAASAVIDLPSAAHWVAQSDNSLSTTFLFRQAINRRIDLDNPKVLPLYNVDLPPIYSLDPAKNKPRGVVAELETQLRKNGSGVSVTQILYVNGRKTEWVTWHLDS